MKFEELPKTIPIFPLSNFIMFPGTTVPLNIFEPRYLQMVNDSMKKHRMIGMIQPKKTGSLKKPDLYEIGCIGKITSFNETEDGRILIILNGICRYKINSELNTDKMYRECNVQYDYFSKDIMQKSNEVNFSDLSLIMKNMRTFFKKQGYIVQGGQVIALAGNTGDFTTGFHLHFELWIDGFPMDPENFFNFSSE